MVVATDDVDELVGEIVVRSEGGAAVKDVGHAFDCLGRQVEYESVTDSLVYLCVLTGNNEHLVVGNVKRATELQGLVQALLSNVFFIFGLQPVPWSVVLMTVNQGMAIILLLNIRNDSSQFFVHDKPAGILVQLVLFLGMRR